MKNFYRITILFFLFCTITNSVKAQLANPAYEIEYTVHYGNYGAIDLTGYVTYEVFIKFANSENYLFAVYGEESPVFDCVFDPVNTTYFNFPCGLFQFESETAFGSENTCLNSFGIPGYEAEPFDSYMTIAYECSSEIGCDVPINAGLCEDWIDIFEGPANGNPFDGGSFFWDDYAVTLAGTFDSGCAASYAGPDNRVKIAQFTSCDGFEGCVNITYKTADQVGTNQFETATDICMQIDHPCLGFPLDTDPTVENPTCFGDEAIVTVEDGGLSTVNYSLFSGSTLGSGTLVEEFLNEDNGLELVGLAPGSYYIAMQEATGCRDTTVVFQIIEPTQVIFEPVLNSSVLCFGETTGEIELICSGGTGVIDIDVNGQGGNACGDVLSNLECGVYDMTATDENGCFVNQVIDIVCPIELEAQLTSSDIPCFDYDNGTITGTVQGGTGEITVDLVLGVDIIETVTGTGTLNINFDELNGGVYTVNIVDANNCSLQFEFTIIEPDPVVVTPALTDAICFNSCDGTVVFDIQGGTGPFVEQVFNSNNQLTPANELCADTYTYDIVDANGCSLTGEFIINEPDQVTFEVTSQAVSCFGICDGTIDIFNVTGGTGVNYSFETLPAAGNCVAPCLGNAGTIENLCAGTYTVNITDEVGCVQPIQNVVIGGPAELIITLNPTNVSCFGFADGQVVITSTGGTGAVTLQPDNSAVPQVISDLAPGNYTFTINDENGCEATDDVTITEPALLVATLTNTINVTCGGECDGIVNYTVTGGTTPYNYLLNPGTLVGVSSGTIGQLCAADYNLTIVDANQCLAPLAFVIEEPTPLEIILNIDAPTCTGMTDGGAVISVLGGTGELTTFISPDTLQIINNGNNTFTVSNLGELTIEVELIDEVGCVKEAEVEVIPDIITDMVLTTWSSPETCWDEQDGTATVGVQNGNLPITYQWFDDLLQTTSTAVGLSSNESYGVRVTDDIGCTLVTSVFVEPTIGCFFITNALTPNGDGSNDTWLIGGLEFFPDATVQVFNRWGQIVFESKGYNAPWDGTLKGEPLPVADYYFLIEYDKEKDPIMGTVTIKY